MREGYGTLEWLGPVDVRGLDLEQVAQIERGACVWSCVVTINVC